VLPQGFFADFFQSNMYKDSRKFYFVKNLYITKPYHHHRCIYILETQLLGLLYGGSASFVQKWSMPWISPNLKVPFLYSLISVIEPRITTEKLIKEKSIFWDSPQKYMTRHILWHIFYYKMLHSKGENLLERFGIKFLILSFWLSNVYSIQLNYTLFLCKE
jgi:hypothetical protein